MSLSSVTRGPSLTDGVVAAVREGIRERRFVPGEIYSVYQLADLLGVSRSPVREGLLKLAEAGLVEFARNRGFRVTLPQPRDVAEIFGVRLSLEPAAARRACLVATDEQLLGVVEHFETLASAAATGDEQSFWVADRRLHREILEAAGNRRAAEVIESLRATTTLLGPPTSVAARTLPQICDEHRPVVEAVRTRDGAVAEAAMREHLTHTGLLLVAQVADLSPGSPSILALWASVVD